MAGRYLRRIRHFKATLCGVVLATILLFFDLRYNLDFSGCFVRFAKSLESWELAEIAICSLVAMIGFFVDVTILHRRMIEKRRLHMARVEVMEKALMKTQHIVNNYLNEMLVFKIQLEKSQVMPKEDIERFGNAIYKAADKLQKIEVLEDLNISFNTQPVKPPASNRQ